ncbi:MAG: sigma-70 family RNA polymerase sigma factor [Planctomycetota bacterium]
MKTPTRTPTDSDSDRRAIARGGLEAEQYESFLRLVADVYPEVQRLIVTLVGNPVDADDVLQNTLVKLLENFGAYDKTRGFRGWACTIAANCARDFLRRERLRRGYGLNDAVVQKLASVSTGIYELTELRSDFLRDCLGRLSVADQQMLWECYGEETSVTEWAKQKRKPRSNVYTRLRRLRGRLYDCVNAKLRNAT